MVLRWFLVSKTIGRNGFPMDFGPKTIASNGFQWFPMVANHWSYDGMVTIHRSGLKAIIINLIAQASSWSQKLTWLQAPARSCWCLAPCCWPRLSGTFRIGGRAGAARFWLLNGHKMLIRCLWARQARNARPIMKMRRCHFRLRIVDIRGNITCE